MKFPEDIIQRCHQRHKAVLRQRKTVVTPALYKNIPYHFNVRCARETLLTLDALEQAHISFMPIGRASENDNGPRDFGGDRFLKRQGRDDWLDRRLFESWGIQIYTGIPSGRTRAQVGTIFILDIKQFVQHQMLFSTCIRGTHDNDDDPVVDVNEVWRAALLLQNPGLSPFKHGCCQALHLQACPNPRKSTPPRRISRNSRGKQL